MKAKLTKLTSNSKLIIPHFVVVVLEYHTVSIVIWAVISFRF